MALAAASAIAALASPVLQPQAQLQQPQAQAPAQAWKPWTPDPKLAPGPSHVCPKQNFLHWMERLGTHPDAQLGDAPLSAADMKSLDALDEHFVTHWDPTRSP